MVRKILFLVFIFFLFVFSVTSAHAEVCKAQITPGPDSDGKTLDNHTHRIDMTITPTTPKYFRSDGKYWVKFIPPKNAVILKNDLDDQLYDYGRLLGRNGALVSTVETSHTGDRDWSFYQHPLPVTCSGDVCSIQVKNVSGNAIIGDDPSLNIPGFNSTSLAPAVFLAGTYGFEVEDGNEGSSSHDALCNGTFEVANTHDYGYNNCKITLANEADSMKMAINQPIRMDGLVWTDPSAPAIPILNLGPGIRVTFEINTIPDDKNVRVVGNLWVNPDNHGVGSDMDALSAPGNYNFTINYGGGVLGAGNDRHACMRGPFHICNVGESGCGLINTQGATPCLVCPIGSNFQGLNSDYAPKCLGNTSDNFGKSVDAKVISCPAGSICSHIEADSSATETASASATGCIGLPGGGDFGGSNVPPPLCSEYDNAADPKACKSIETGLGVSLPTDPGGLISALIGVVLSAAGGIAIVLIMISGYRMMISQGNPEQIKDARDQLTAAIIGLLFVIFSLVILQVIGFNILKLPGFGG